MVGHQLDDEPNLYIGNGCLNKHPFKTDCLGFLVLVDEGIGGPIQNISGSLPGRKPINT